MESSKPYLFKPTERNMVFMEAMKMRGVPFSVLLRLSLDYYEEKTLREDAAIERWKRETGGA